MKTRMFVICFNFRLGCRKWNTCFVDIFNIFNRDFKVLCQLQILFPHFFSDICSHCFISCSKSQKTCLLWSDLKVWIHPIVGKPHYFVITSPVMMPLRQINLKSVQTLFLWIYKYTSTHYIYDAYKKWRIFKVLLKLLFCTTQFHFTQSWSCLKSH